MSIITTVTLKGHKQLARQRQKQRAQLPCQSLRAVTNDDTGYTFERDGHRFSIVNNRKSRDLFQVAILVSGWVWSVEIAGGRVQSLSRISNGGRGGGGFRALI
jgi:hypothetical protein